MNPRTIRHKDILPANHHPKTSPAWYVPRTPCPRKTWENQEYYTRSHAVDAHRPIYTGRTLGQRLKEHQRAVRDRNTSTSGQADHVCSTGHPVDWNKAQILDSFPQTSKWCFLESWMIQQPSSLNRELGPWSSWQTAQKRQNVPYLSHYTVWIGKRSWSISIPYYSMYIYPLHTDYKHAKELLAFLHNIPFHFQNLMFSLV